MINLHNHSYYSFRDGLPSVKEIVDKAKSLNQPGVAITDHGNMNAWVDLYFTTKSESVKPIYGCEFYIVKDCSTKIKEKNNHLIMLAKNLIGLKAMFELLYQSFRTGFYYVPRIDFSIIERIQGLKGNVIVSTACLAGELSRLVLNSNVEGQKEFIRKYRRYFGEDFYLEVQFNEIDDQKLVSQRIVEISKKSGVKCFVTADSHYVDRDDFLAHRDLLYLQTGMKRKDSKKARSKSGLWEFDAKELYIKSCDDFVSDANKWGYEFSQSDLNTLTETTMEIFEKISVVELDTSLKIYIPKQYKDKSEEERFEVLESACIKGLKKKHKNIENFDKDLYMARLERELELIKEKGLYDYFLTVMDLLTIVRAKGIIVGAGRGCFVPGTRVKIENGLFVDIEDLSIGDLVLTHNGNAKFIEDIFEYDIEENIIQLILDNGKTIECTKEHEFWVEKDGMNQWMKAEDLDECCLLLEV